MSGIRSSDPTPPLLSRQLPRIWQSETGVLATHFADFTSLMQRRTECFIRHRERLAWLRAALRSLSLQGLLAPDQAGDSSEFRDLQSSGEGATAAVRHVFRAFGAGVIAGTWQPNNPNLLTEGYPGVVTQAIFGVCANWLGEFAPDIKRMLKRDKPETGQKADSSIADH